MYSAYPTILLKPIHIQTSSQQNHNGDLMGYCPRVLDVLATVARQLGNILGPLGHLHCHLCNLGQFRFLTHRPPLPEIQRE